MKTLSARAKNILEHAGIIEVTPSNAAAAINDGKIKKSSRMVGAKTWEELKSFAGMNHDLEYVAAGLTKREWFAGMAMQSLAASVFRDAQLRMDNPSEALSQLVNGCANIADAMLAALERKDQP